MKLDTRIIEGKKPLDCFDSEYAKQFIGKKGFITDELDQFCDLSKMNETTLKNVWQNETRCFFASAIAMRFKYFLPSEWVNMEEPEKKWRSFSLTEWQHDYDIGEEIIFRLKKSDTVRVYEYCGYVSDSDDDSPGKGVINLGGELFVLQNLFDQFELRESGEWQPFGVEEASE